MTKEYINFKKQRELGEIITDTFKFLRGNYKLLLKLVAKIAGPAFLILIFALGYYHYTGGGNPFLSIGEERMDLFFLSLFVLMICALAFFVLLQGTVLFYVKSYVANQGKVVEQEVYAGVRKNFAKLVGVMFLAALLTFIGVMFCFLPGIYLWVPLSMSVPLLVFNNRGVFDALGDSFDLIKDNWWITFASLFVMSLLAYIIGLIFQIPMMIYIFFKAFTVAQEGSAADPASLFDWVYTLLSVIASLAQYLLFGIVTIATAFIYYNLDEKKNFTGTYETISNLGTSEPN